jgi:CheY-like chemotaxis protein
VEFATTGEQGLQMIRDLRPEIVFCDWRLPGIGGQEVARAVRSEPEIASTTLICLTARGDENTRQSAMGCGFDLHLVKPPEIDTLERLLEEPFLAGNAPAADARGKEIERERDSHRQIKQKQRELARVEGTTPFGTIASSLLHEMHEMDQPLTGIMSNAQAGRRLLAAEDPDIGELREVFEYIIGDTRRAVAFTRNIRATIEKEAPVLERQLKDVVEESGKKSAK